jgi:hypothetical protein
MTAGAAGRGRLRAADADRDQVIDTLKTAFVEGRLTKDELGARAGRALAARTFAELIAITADIPGKQIELPPPSPKLAPVRARKPVSKKVLAWSTFAVVVPSALGAAFLTYSGGFLVIFVFAFIGLTVATGPSHRGMGA